MALPAALLGAGRIIASQGLKQGLKTASKNFAKEKVKDIAKKKAQSFIKKKDDGKGGGLVKRDSGDGGEGGSGGFFGGGFGGGGGSGGFLVKTKKIDIKKLSLIDKEETSSNQKKFDGSELIDELTKIKNNLITIKKISSSNLSSFLSEQRNRRREQEFSKRKNKEDNLEATKEKTKKPKSKKGKKSPGFLDLISGFIKNVLLGSLVNYLWKYIPQILEMFEEIANGLTNVWQRVRLSIISASVLFRRQIRFVFNLGKKILKFSAPLIKKSGSIVKKVLGFAGKRIFNLIKGATGLALKLAKKLVPGAVKAATPIVKGTAKVVGKVVGGAVKAGGSAIKAAGNAVNIVKRFKFVSNLFKKIPFIGALIGIGIDLAMGERVDKAIAGAAGASLGTAVGAAIGTGIIPIPVVGTWVGGAVGGAIGDWAGKKIYSNLIGLQDVADKEAPVDPVEQKYSAGRIGQRSTSVVSRSSSTSSPGTISTINSKVSSATESNAKKNIFTDEKSLETYKEIRSKLGTSSFVGELMQISLDVGLGEKINKTRTDNAAKQIGYSVGDALSESKVFGFNKRLVEPISEDLTEWAKKAIFNDLTRVSLNNDYDDKRIKSESYKENPNKGTSTNTPQQQSKINISGGTSDFWTLAAVASREDGDPQGRADVAQSIYNRAASGAYGTKSISGLITRTWQYEPTWRYPNGASKGNGVPNPEWLQIKDLSSASAATGTSEDFVKGAADAILNPKYQKDAIDFIGGRTDFTNYPKSERKGQILRKKGDNYFGWDWNYSGNTIGAIPNFGATSTSITKASSSSSGGGGKSPDSNRPTVAGSPIDVKNRKIFLHWSAGGYNTPFSAYHSIVLGSGEKVQNTPYDKDKSGHTAGGNTNSVGLAVAAAAGATENNLKTPPTTKQLDVMTSEAANLAKSWGWTPAKVDSNVKTHGEWERYAVPAGILSPPVQRWDLDKLSQSDRFGSGGPKLRDMIKSKMSAMGGGKGNGGPVKKHKASEFIMGGGKRVLTSGMGMRDFALSPGMHMGVDINGTTGEPLQAFSDGVVQDTGYEAGGYGNWVSWIDDNGIGHFYAHMNKPAFVRKGQRIKKGTILGELGSTGRSDGPHLHWETATNPSDTGRSKSAVLSRFNPLSKYGIDAPFGGTIQPDPSIASSSSSSPTPSSSSSSPTPSSSSSSPTPSSSSSSPTPSSSSSKEQAKYDLNFKIEGGKVKQFYLDALADGSYTGPSVNSIKEEASYEKEGASNIIMIPMQGSSSPNTVNGRINKSGGSLIGSVNSNIDIYNKSLKQVIVSAFYKI